MRLLVDGVAFQSGLPESARFWRGLLPCLADDTTIELVILDRGGAPRIDGATLVPFPTFHDRYNADESLLLQKLCDHLRIDIFTSTHHTTPLTTPMLLVIQDMAAQPSGDGLESRMELEKEIAICFARRFLASSVAVRDELIKCYPEIPQHLVSLATPGGDATGLEGIEATADIFKRDAVTLQSEAAAGIFDAFFAAWRPLRLIQSGVDVLTTGDVPE